MSSHILCIGDVMLDVVTKIKVMPSAINYAVIQSRIYQLMAAVQRGMLLPG